MNQNVTISTLVEINVSGDRCGVPAGNPVLTLCRKIIDSSHLNFTGLHAYQGNAQHIRSFTQREDAITQVVNEVRQTVELLQDHGIHCATITGAGSGTWQFEGSSGVYTELQAGSYVFLDADYAKNKDASGELNNDFDQSLFILTTVMSVPASDFVVVDAGLKSLAFDSGMPVVATDPSIKYRTPSDEHGILDLSESTRKFSLGEKIWLIPGHCDPTVNLHDWYVCIRGKTVESIWEVTARGAVF